MSNRLRHELDAIIHARKGYIQLPDKWVPLRKHSKSLSVVDLSDLLCGLTADCLQANVTTDSRGRAQQHQMPKPGSREQLSNQRPLPETSLRQPSLTTPDFESKECSEVAGPDAESRCGRAALRAGEQGPQRGTDPPRGVHRKEGVDLQHTAAASHTCWGASANVIGPLRGGFQRRFLLGYGGWRA